ncbi:MAG: VPLPA-CTERM-specific exosortase XrtD [Gammaproteobacteria bacterium]|nr:VPLPA-CTERM-specific exosortase XrtD [Gammaproteobacteria bacterium]
MTSIGLGFAFAGGLLNLFERWSKQEEYSHGFIIPLVALYFIWQKRSYLETLPVSPSPWGIVAVAIGLTILLLGELTAIFILTQYAFVIVLFGLVLAFAGSRITRAVAVPLLLLLFAIPLPYFIDSDLSGELQLISSQFGVGVIRLFNIPVYLEGNVIDLGTYQLLVTEACSGLRYLYPLMSFGFICAYLWKADFWKKVIVFVSTVPITVVLNSFRIGAIGFLVENFGIAQAEGFLHDFEGWIIFMTCVVILLCEMAVLGRIGTLSPVSTMFDKPFTSITDNTLVGDKSIPRPFLISGALVLGAAVAIGVISERADAVPERRSFASFPLVMDEWRGRAEQIPENVLNKLQLTDYLLVDFTRADGGLVNLYVAYYENQRKGQSPHSPRVCIPGGGWQIASFERTLLDAGIVGTQPLHFNRVVIRRGEERQLVYYWFQQRGRLIANEYLAKWYLFRDAAFRNRTDGALVRLTTPVAKEHDLAVADARLRKLASKFVHALDAYVPS